MSVNIRKFEGIKGVMRSRNQRRLDNTKVKRKRSKGQTVIYKAYTEN